MPRHQNDVRHFQAFIANAQTQTRAQVQLRTIRPTHTLFSPEIILTSLFPTVRIHLPQTSQLHFQPHQPPRQKRHKRQQLCLHLYLHMHLHLHLHHRCRQCKSLHHFGRRALIRPSYLLCNLHWRLRCQSRVLRLHQCFVLRRCSRLPKKHQHSRRSPRQSRRKSRSQYKSRRYQHQHRQSNKLLQRQFRQFQKVQKVHFSNHHQQQQKQLKRHHQQFPQKRHQNQHKPQHKRQHRHQNKHKHKHQNMQKHNMKTKR